MAGHPLRRERVGGGAMAPLIAIQIMGVLYQLKLKRATSDALIMIDVDDNAIMDIEEE